jgi:hypothetical protein
MKGDPLLWWAYCHRLGHYSEDNTPFDRFISVQNCSFRIIVVAVNGDKSRSRTSAMEAGLTDHIWFLEELGHKHR